MWVTPSNLDINLLFKSYTKTAFLMWELLIISKFNLLDSSEDQLEIKGVSVKLNGKLLKYHSPLNNVLFFIWLTIVEWLELTNLAKVLSEG